METNNLLYLAYLDVVNKTTLIQYPDPPSLATSSLVNSALDQIFESIDRRKGSGEEISVELEGASLFCLVGESYDSAVMLITLGKYYPRRFATGLLNEFTKKISEVFEDSQALSLHDFDEFMKDLFARYDKVVKNDEAARVKFKVDDAIDTVGITIQQVMNSCANIEILGEKTLDLRKNAKHFNTVSNDLNNTLRRQWVIAIIVLVIITTAIITYIIIPFVH